MPYCGLIGTVAVNTVVLMLMMFGCTKPGERATGRDEVAPFSAWNLMGSLHEPRCMADGWLKIGKEVTCEECDCSVDLGGGMMKAER